jgi:hypothetical protein
MNNQKCKKESTQPVVLKAYCYLTRRHSPNGFALIASLLILSLLALIAFGMLSLSNVTHTTRQKFKLFRALSSPWILRNTTVLKIDAIQ